MNTRMKILTLWQPWATLIRLGAKQYETRSWSTPYRGLVAIHSAKHFTGDEVDFCNLPRFRQVLIPAGYTPPFKGGFGKPALPLGAVLCIVNLIDVIRTEVAVKSITDQERAFGNFSPNRFAWKLQVVHVFSKPIFEKGQQGLRDWTLPEEIKLP